MPDLVALLKPYVLHARIARWLVFVVAALWLFLPVSAREALMIESIREKHGAYIGVAFLAAGVWLLLDGIGGARAWWGHRRDTEHAQKALLETLVLLDDAERAILREFSRQRRNTLCLPYLDPIVAGLVTKGVLVIAGEWGRGYDLPLPMAIRPAVREHLARAPAIAS